jgi:hypothetical protein
MAGEYVDEADWVVWNGTMGVIDRAAIGTVRDGPEGRQAWLAEPYDVVGPFSLDALEAEGRIGFGECLVMSRLRWQQDQVALRIEAREKRAAMLRRFNRDEDDRDYRMTLDLPLDGALEPALIRAAFRRLAKTAHPDAGGSDAHYREICEARDVLLRLFEGV